VKKVVPLLVVSAALIVVAALWAPDQWRWPAIGVVVFVAFFVTTRVASIVITDEAEKRFNRRD
jgi:hypothetical protein